MDRVLAILPPARTAVRLPVALRASYSVQDMKQYPLKVKIHDENLKDAMVGKLVGSIDQGTSSSRFIVFTDQAKIVGSAQMEHNQYFPKGKDKVGWHEHDPLEIWYRTQSCIDALAIELKQKGLDLWKKRLEGVGITNQRETTIAWDANTGKPYYNAIVWDDVRTSSIARKLAKGRVDRFRKQTGLPLAPYFAGTKVRWLIDNVPLLRENLKDESKQSAVRFGTIDTWLLYQLTGTPSEEEGAANIGGIHITDVSNASRWLFLDIHKMAWDPKVIRQICNMDIPLSAFPDICPSSQVYSVASPAVSVLEGIPLAAILGDQQSALFGQCAHKPGEAKNTYGTGMFLMMNTGTSAVPSKAGLLTTVAYKLGENGPVHYALEGSVSHSGSTIQWLRDQLQIIKDAAESDTLASQTEQNDGLYFVPAFSGLFAPFWRSDARGCIVGMTATHHKGHICRAALEAAAYQARELFDAIYSDSQVVLKSLRVDGGGTQSKLLCQFQADMLEVPVEKPLIMETTALGAAFAAGLATGVWKDLDEIQDFCQVSETYYPKLEDRDRERFWKGWKKAVDRSLDWADPEPLPESLRQRTIFSLLRRKLNRARRKSVIKTQRLARNLFG